MSSEIKYISTITPETKNWTAKVRVMEKSSPKNAMHSSHKYQRLILIDGQGVRVQATIFGNDIDTLGNTLYPLAHYYISNAVVRPIQEQHRLVNNRYQWTISTKTPIREIPNDELQNKMITTPYNIVSLARLSEHIDPRSQVDILAAVVDAYPSKISKSGITFQEVLLVNQEMNPTIITLWDDFVSNEGAHISQYLDSYPVVLATRLKVSSFNGLSISTRSSSTFIFSPTTPEGLALQEWVANNKDSIKEVIKNRQAPLTVSMSQQNVSTMLVTIDKLPTINKDKPIWVRASASIKNKSQKMWYMCCDTCVNGIHAEYSQKFNCRFCGQERTAQPRCRYALELSDDTGTVTAIIYGKNAEKVIQTTAIKIMESSNEGGHFDINVIETDVMERHRYFMLKHYKKEDNKFTVINVDENQPNQESQNP